jgi:hypothetical protein
MCKGCLCADRVIDVFASDLEYELAGPGRKAEGGEARACPNAKEQAEHHDRR